MINQYTNGTFDREANAIRYINERTPMFEYAGNFTGVDGHVDLKCKKCGTISRKSFVCVRHGKVKCRYCAEEKQKEKQQRLHAKKAQAELDRSIVRGKQLLLVQCKDCGQMFVPSHGNQLYCSEVCQRRGFNAISKDRRIRKLKKIIVDKDITLEKLYAKSNGVCSICGNVCSWKDSEWKDGTFIAHNNYPSIDHILPISKGGLHSWSNVQLACRGCNSKKGADAYLPIQ